jgi:carbonic anhydrase
MRSRFERKRGCMTDEREPGREEVEQSYLELLDGNRRWVGECLAEDPDYFKNMAQGQSPKYLWIGCADSRVPANVITGTRAGDVFVHRNIANVVVHTDTNMLSVLQFAVEHLKVQHVIVCGHYGCGGVAAAMTDRDYGLMNTWLSHIKDTYRIHREELSAYPQREDMVRRMVELNVIEGVLNLGKSYIIQRAWAERGWPEIHGWVYDVRDGLIRELNVDFREPAVLEEHYRYRFER